MIGSLTKNVAINTNVGKARFNHKGDDAQQVHSVQKGNYDDNPLPKWYIMLDLAAAAFRTQYVDADVQMSGFAG